ncbi:MAG: sulfatase-like hydrolase/transferase, partial [Muribaculaceae bacterium]|nr:sulfatase-like hydrolase/transferase [Muribaculaceae bacterium]
GETAVFGGFPAFDPFYYMLSPYNKNIVDSPARLLKGRGWTTAFFYGVNPGSFNMDQTAFALGYDKIYTRKSYGNDSDFDGKWGIFDIPMAEFTVRTLSTLPQPFMAAWFTISAHGPFTLPKEFDTSSFRHKEPSPERGLEYTDLALRRFFTMAAATPWFSNTTFIITGDHGNRDFKGTDYDTDFVRNRIPFIIYTPDGTLSPQTIGDRVLSQFDIAPTTLGLVGYDRPYVSLGRNALDENEPFFGIYRGDGGRYLIADTTMAVYTDASCTRVEQIFDLRYDPCLRNPLGSVDSPYADTLLMHAKAFIQDYTSRLNDDRMTIGHP